MEHDDAAAEVDGALCLLPRQQAKCPVGESQGREMARPSEVARVVRLRLIAEAPPPEYYQDWQTDFGLQDKKQVLHNGQKRPDGSVHFDLEVEVTRNLST